MSYPIIICGDQRIRLNLLESIIRKFTLFHNDTFQINFKTQNPIEVLNYIQRVQPSNGIYLLDIDFNHSVNGVELAEKIRAQDVEAKIILITTYKEMLLLTIQKRIEILGVILKDQPLESFQIEIADLLMIAQQRIDALRMNKKQAFVFSIGPQTFILDIQEVYFIESSSLPHKVILYTKDEFYEFYGSLKDLEKQYPALFRMSRSCLVNPLNIKKINFKTRTVFFSSDLIRTFSLKKAPKIKEELDKFNTNTLNYSLYKNRKSPGKYHD